MAKKKEVPPELQTAFYEIADAEMERRIKLGLLSNRFTIREFAMQMLCKGYYYEQEKLESNAKANQSADK
jgi:hypothetical protein